MTLQHGSKRNPLLQHMISISARSMFPDPAHPRPADFDPFPAPPRIVGKGGFPALPRPVDFLPSLSPPCPASEKNSFPVHPCCQYTLLCYLGCPECALHNLPFLSPEFKLRELRRNIAPVVPTPPLTSGISEEADKFDVQLPRKRFLLLFQQRN